MAATATLPERTDIRTLLGGGLRLGLVTVAGVVLFALLSRGLSGAAETALQSLVIVAGGVLVTYLPATWVRPRAVDGIGWTALLGVIGAVVFAFVDTVALRPAGLYPWTWDAIGGGSGWWYLPIWLMGAAFLSWLGAWIYAIRADTGAGAEPRWGLLAGPTAGLTVVIFGVLVVSGAAPFHPSVAGLAWALALVVSVPTAAMLRGR